MKKIDIANNTISYKAIFLLFWLPTAYSLFSFILSLVGIPFQAGAYIELLIFIYLLAFLAKITKSGLLPFLILTLFITYSLLGVGDVFGKARESVSFFLAITALLTLPKLNIKKEDLTKSHKMITTFIPFLLIAYFLSIVTRGIYLDTRVYLSGFIIAHAFNYLVILLGFYMHQYKFKKYGFFLISLSIFTGTRSGLILALLTFIYLFLKDHPLNLKLIIRFVLMSFIVVFALMSLRSHIPTLDTVLKTFEGKGGSSYSYNLLDKGNIEFSYGRTYLWFNAYHYFQKQSNGAFIPVIIGHGSFAIENLSNNLYRKSFWMHNDFVQIYFCYGLMGILIYLIAILKFRKYNYYGNYFFIFLLLSAMLNGFYKYAVIQYLIIFYLLDKTNNLRMDKNIE
jgi:hypothetical protein